MSLPSVIDIDAILAAIPGEKPGGSDPRENASGSAPYYRVKDARNAARAEERASVDTDAGVPEAWSTVVETAAELLTGQAKDLEIAAWMTEGLIRVDGFAGLRDGLTVIAGLVEAYWEHLFPEPDEDGVETKVAPIAGLNGSGAIGTLDQPIRNASIAEGSDGSYSYWHYEQAIELEKITDSSRRDSRIENGAITLEAFRKSVAGTPLEDLRNTIEAIGACEAALARMSAALDLAAGADAPSVSNLLELLAAVGGCLRFVAADRLAAAADAALTAEGGQVDPADAAAMTGDAAQGAAVTRRPGEFANRDEALKVLTQIAAFFRRTEPHSTLSYTIEDAVRRARMTLPELLKELVQDPDHMRYMLLSAGIKYEEPEAQ